MRLPALAGAVALLLCCPTQAGAETYTRSTVQTRLVHQIAYHRRMTWRLEDKMHRSRLETQHRERGADTQLLRRLKHYWEHHHYLAWVRWERLKRSVEKSAVGLPPHYNEWLCIHRYEGAWNAVDKSGTYYGGLQMDYGFMSTYGPDDLKRYGTANNWPILDQMWAAERAWKTRGFYPWPNTAHYCGLI